MTNGIKTPSGYYLELITTFPPRPITNEAELIITQNRINSILDKKNLIQDDRDYLKVLAIIVADYEEKNETLPIITGIELLRVLLSESNLQPQDLKYVLGDENTVLDILNGKRQLTKNERQTLGEYFKISPSYFVSDNDKQIEI